LDEEDDNIDESFLGVSIVSTINIEKARFDMSGFYQCIGVHQEIHAQQTFNVHVNIKGKSKARKRKPICMFCLI
jgi:hypothetical protein